MKKLTIMAAALFSAVACLAGTYQVYDFTMTVKTTKGKGVSFMENVASWHHGVPSEEQYQQAIKEINDHIAALEKNV